MFNDKSLDQQAARATKGARDYRGKKSYRVNRPTLMTTKPCLFYHTAVSVATF